MKKPISQQDLEAHLARQLYFLEASCEAFDKGVEDEAFRLATTIRVLLHDTKKSHSLLSLLGTKNVKFLDSAIPLDTDNLTTHSGLVFTAIGPPRTRYVAMLDDMPFKVQMDFDTWWTSPVFKDTKSNLLSRKDLVLIAANQDGGAHVDPEIDEVYHDLARSNSLGWMATDGTSQTAMGGPERAAIRQIAHELLKTLKPGYQKVPKHDAGAFVGGTVFKKVEGGVANPPRKMGRNEPCFCGSSIKYKKCHGRLTY